MYFHSSAFHSEIMLNFFISISLEAHSSLSVPKRIVDLLKCRSIENDPLPASNREFSQKQLHPRIQGPARRRCQLPRCPPQAKTEGEPKQVQVACPAAARDELARTKLTIVKTF